MSLILIALFFILQSVFGIINNNYYIPKLKKEAKYAQMPVVSIQVIGRGESPEVFTNVLERLKNQTYSQTLIKRVVLSIDGNHLEGKEMIDVFKSAFPRAKEVNLGSAFSSLDEDERQQLIVRHSRDQHLIVTQPHGGRRQVKYTAFSFSSHESDYVMHCDSDTLVELDALENLALTAVGYNVRNPDLKPCGGVCGEIRINNILNYLALQMEISYWYAFFSGRSSQSLFNCVTTISGAMGLFHSESIKEVIKSYPHQTFFGIKCVFGEDRHLTSGLIENDQAVLFDCTAVAQTETPLKLNGLMIQQSRWYKGFYRETIVFFPKLFHYSWYSVLTLFYSFFIPFLSFITLFTVVQSLEDLIFFMIYIFIATFLMSLRGITRSCQFRFIHALTHPLFFFLFLLPLKTLGLITCICSDLSQKTNRWIVLLPAYIWMIAASAIFVGLGLYLNIVPKEQKLNRWMSSGLFFFAVLMVLLFLHWIIWGLGFYVPANKKALSRMYSLTDGSIVPLSHKQLSKTNRKYSTGNTSITSSVV